MKKLRTIRTIVSLLMLITSTAYFLMPQHLPHLERIAVGMQIIPSLLSASIGISIFWLIVSGVFGRIYCAAFCPLAGLQDLLIRVFRKFRIFRIKYRYKQPKRFRYDALLLYIVSLVLSFGSAMLLLEPTTIYANIIEHIRPTDETSSTLIYLGVGTAIGLACAIISIVILVILTAMRGREFCNSVCPLGQAFSMLERFNIYRIEIDTDICDSCLKCEEICKTSCINAVSRHIDNSQCIRCFNCIAECPQKAIRFQAGRNSSASPLFNRAKQS